MKKKGLALLLAACMLLGMAPALAAEGESTGVNISHIISNFYNEASGAYDVRNDVSVIVLDQDTTLTSPINIVPADGGTVTLDLNGHTLTVGGDGAALRINDDCGLNIDDLSEDRAGKIEGKILETMEMANGQLLIFRGTFTEDPTAYAPNGNIVNSEGTYAVNLNGEVIASFAGRGWTYGYAVVREDGTVDPEKAPGDPGFWDLEYNIFYGWCLRTADGFYNLDDLIAEVNGGNDALKLTEDTVLLPLSIAKAWAVNFYYTSYFYSENWEHYHGAKTEEFNIFNGDDSVVSVTLPEEPTQEGKNFVAWFVPVYVYDEDGNATLVGTETFDPENVDYNKDVFARWDEDYTIGFAVEPANGTITVTDEAGTVVEPTETGDDGYTYFQLNRANVYSITFAASGYQTVVRDTATAYDNWGQSVTELIDLYGAGFKWQTAVVVLEQVQNTYVPPYTPPTQTETTENDDGSTTTTVTNNQTGTVTETTENPDGSSVVVETTKDGTVTTTVADAEGNTTETVAAPETVVENEDGSVTTTASVTTSVENTDGSTASSTTVTTTTVDAEGNETSTVTTTSAQTAADGTTSTATTVDGVVEAEVTLSETAVASEEPTALPIPAIDTALETASTVTVSTGAAEPAQAAVSVEIPLTETSQTVVAVLVNEDGTETIIKDTVASENGIIVDIPDGSTVKIVDNSKSFDDVQSDDWHSDAIDFVTSRELFNGTGDGKFTTDANMTRGMLVTVLARLDGVDTTPDEGQHWQEKGLNWAVEMGISNGADPDNDVTREQIVVMLWRYAGSPAADFSLDQFSDSGVTSSWAVDAMKWAAANGIVQGSDGKLNPAGYAQRSEVAKFIQNFVENT